MNAQVFSRHINFDNLTSPSAFQLDESPKDKLKEYNFNLLFGIVEIDVPLIDSDDFTAISYFDGDSITFSKLESSNIHEQSPLSTILSQDMDFNLSNIDNLFAGNVLMRKTEFPASKGKCWMLFGGCYSAKIDYILKPETLYNFNNDGVNIFQTSDTTGDCLEGVYRLPIWGDNNNLSIQSTMDLKIQKSTFNLHKKLTNPDIHLDDVRKLCDEFNTPHSMGVHPDYKYYKYMAELNKRNLVLPTWKMFDKETLHKIETSGEEIMAII
jgi:hypothetical protein